SRLQAQMASDGFATQECYRILQKCLGSELLVEVQSELRSGIPFHPKKLLSALFFVTDTIKEIGSRIPRSHTNIISATNEIMEMVDKIRAVGRESDLTEDGIACDCGACSCYD
ncbi:MAG: hypothetical protein MUO77_04450, partial [Anaerolineales bacterium]|nr:hypothetical protein [Anaerolineales bacterium]